MSSSSHLSSASTTPTPTASKLPDPNPNTDHRILAVVIILGIVGAFLLGYIVHITLQVKRRQDKEAEAAGPYQGTLINSDEHPAAQITPFGSGVGGYSGPRFKHKPGEDMRIAIRRPDGAWHFADSRTPFTPVGVNELDVVPSPISSATSLLSFNTRFPPPVSPASPLHASNHSHFRSRSRSQSQSQSQHRTNMSTSTSATRSAYDLNSDWSHHRDKDVPPLPAPPQPAYHRGAEPCREHFDDGRSDL